MSFIPFTPHHGESWMKTSKNGTEKIFWIYHNPLNKKLMRSAFGSRFSEEVSADMINGKNGWLQINPRVN